MEAREKITDALISTRDGKVNSIVKIVQVESASMKTGEVSQEDRMEVKNYLEKGKIPCRIEEGYNS